MVQDAVHINPGEDIRQMSASKVMHFCNATVAVSHPDLGVSDIVKPSPDQMSE